MSFIPKPEIFIERGPRARNYKHGHKRPSAISREYAAYRNMMARCYNPKNARFPTYGARGISVCERWRGNFLLFLEDLGRCPGAGFSLERIDNQLGYEPGNCRWATRQDQANNRRSSKLYDIGGVTKTQAQWASEYGISQSLLHSRLKRGWKILDALTIPVRKGRGT